MRTFLLRTISLLILSTLVLGCLGPRFYVTLSKKGLRKAKRMAPEGFVWIYGGSSHLTLHFENSTKDISRYRAGFYLSETEVSNKEYRDWLRWQLIHDNDNYNESVPDTTIWKNALAVEGEFDSLFFDTHEYDNYPVVGVSWFQANAYAEWYTQQFKPPKEGLEYPKFRLPTAEDYAMAITQETLGWRDSTFMAHSKHVESAAKAFATSLLHGGLSKMNPALVQTKAMAANKSGIYALNSGVREWTGDMQAHEFAEMLTVSTRVTPTGIYHDGGYRLTLGELPSSEDVEIPTWMRAQSEAELKYMDQGYADTGFRLAMSKPDWLSYYRYRRRGRFGIRF